ncbi:UNVERIFIED_CONTAM: hypothetical protein Sangu_0310100 [Sesamum angustifolium]|uniref:Transmembrane protein n=1 Tax=Sesamum angustifolium TaxID=2727405 RepID=A0AAW2QPU9_9LAMI
MFARGSGVRTTAPPLPPPLRRSHGGGGPIPLATPNCNIHITCHYPLGIGYPKSFLNSFVRSISIVFQGVWLVVMGFMLWTPTLIPKGCFMNLEEGHKVVRCHGEEALERAKSLVNIQFNWYVMG